MNALQRLTLAGLALLGSAVPGPASIQAQMYCWAFDSEFPVPCDQGGDEEDEEATAADGVRPG